MSDILKIRALLQRDDQLSYKVGLTIGQTINWKPHSNFVEGSGLVIYVVSVWSWYLLADFEASDGGGKVWLIHVTCYFILLHHVYSMSKHLNLNTFFELTVKLTSPYL